MRSFLLTAALLATTGLAEAQITKPPLSPRSKVTQGVGLGEVSLDYGRPSVRGRSIFGGQEAYGVVWRTGANSSTKITFSQDTTVGGENVEAGTYGLYTIPEAKAWTFILSSDSNLWGAGGYDPANDVLRVELPVKRLESVHETLTIDFQGLHANGADLVISWEHVQVSVPLVVDSDSKVLAEIDERVRKAKGEVSARTYFDAGMYLYQNDGDLKEAASWIDKACDMQPGAFWQKYYQAELALKMGDKKKAMKAATTALELAEKSPQGDFGYAARSRELIKKMK